RNGEFIYAEKDDSKPARLKILGSESNTSKQALDDVMRKRAEREAREGRASTVEERDQDDADYLAEIITDWENLAWNGVEKFSKETVRDLCLNRAFVRNQAKV